MKTEAWLNTDHQLVPGTELFRSDRCFVPWAYTASHGQLLLRSTSGEDWLRRRHETTVDVLFKPVTAMKLRSQYTGLTLGSATAEEGDHIRSSNPGVRFRDDDRFFVLRDNEGCGDHVVCLGVGWKEGVLDGQPSFFAGQDEPALPRWSRRPLFGVDAGLSGNVATEREFVEALMADDTTTVDREKYRIVYVLMIRLDLGIGEPRVAAVGVFLTREEAEHERVRLEPKVDGSWIDEVPIGI